MKAKSIRSELIESLRQIVKIEFANLSQVIKRRVDLQRSKIDLQNSSEVSLKEIRMKQLFTSLVLVGFMSFAGPALAQTSGGEGHSGHQPTETGAQTEKSGHEGMSGHMGHGNMEHMKGMMEECMKNHKDGKMCNEKMMEQCHSGKMAKEDCHKMMKNMKAKKK